MEVQGARVQAHAEGPPFSPAHIVLEHIVWGWLGGRCATCTEAGPPGSSTMLRLYPVVQGQRMYGMIIESCSMYAVARRQALRREAPKGYTAAVLHGALGHHAGSGLRATSQNEGMY